MLNKQSLNGKAWIALVTNWWGGGDCWFITLTQGDSSSFEVEWCHSEKQDTKDWKRDPSDQGWASQSTEGHSETWETALHWSSVSAQAEGATL